MRQVKNTRTSRKLERLLLEKEKRRNGRVSVEERLFRKRFGRVESDKFETILKNYKDLDGFPFSRRVQRTLNWIRWMGLYRETIKDGSYIPFENETEYMENILEQRKKILESLNSDTEITIVLGIEKASNTKLTEACPIIMELLKHKKRRVRGSAAVALGHFNYTEASHQIDKLSKDENEHPTVRSEAKMALRCMQLHNPN